MTFKELKSALAELSEEQLEQTVTFRGDTWFEMTAAQSFDGVPFFALEVNENEDGE